MFATREDVAAETFVLTLATWGPREPGDFRRWYQTSRPGQNLVLQLNFSSEHDRAYEKLVRARGEAPFAFPSHPARVDDCLTLAWARLDVDLDAGEALIEEIQADWVRQAALLRADLDEWISAGMPPHLGPWSELDAGAFELLAYLERVLRPIAALWPQAMLSAAIWFLRNELSLHRIYIHTHESGLRFKRMNPEFAPPRSLYTTLPEQFCFHRTDVAPRAIRQCRHPEVRSAGEAGVDWFVLEV